MEESIILKILIEFLLEKCHICLKPRQKFHKILILKFLGIYENVFPKPRMAGLGHATTDRGSCPWGNQLIFESYKMFGQKTQKVSKFK